MPARQRPSTPIAGGHEPAHLPVALVRCEPWSHGTWAVYTQPGQPAQRIALAIRLGKALQVAESLSVTDRDIAQHCLDACRTQGHADPESPNHRRPQSSAGRCREAEPYPCATSIRAGCCGILEHGWHAKLWIVPGVAYGCHPSSCVVLAEYFPHLLHHAGHILYGGTHATPASSKRGDTKLHSREGLKRSRQSVLQPVMTGFCSSDVPPQP